MSESHKKLFITVLVIFFFILRLPTVKAKIYTYEKDGVIVMSTEPPPRPLRKNKIRTSLSSTHGKTKRKSERKKKRNTVQGIRKNRNKMRINPLSLQTPYYVNKHKSVTSRLSIKYQLPKAMIHSVISACYYLNKEFKNLDTNVACLSDRVKKSLSELLKTKQNKEELNIKTSEAARTLEPSLWLLRHLINFYRGDVTLALSAYYMTGQSLETLQFFIQSSLPRKLSDFLNKSEYEIKSERHGLKLLRPNQEAKRFTQLLLYIYHKIK